MSMGDELRDHREDLADFRSDLEKVEAFLDGMAFTSIGDSAVRVDCYAMLLGEINASLDELIDDVTGLIAVAGDDGGDDALSGFVRSLDAAIGDIERACEYPSLLIDRYGADWAADNRDDLMVALDRVRGVRNRAKGEGVLRA